MIDRLLPRGNRQIAGPNLTVNLPLPVVRFPDNDILAHIQKLVSAVKKPIGAHFIDRVRQPVEIDRLPWHRADAHVKTALPEGLDRGAPADGCTVGRHNLPCFGVKRRDPARMTLLKTVLPLALYQANRAFAFFHRGRGYGAGQR